MSHINLLHLFGGIGSVEESMRMLHAFTGGEFTFNVVDYVEISKYSVTSYNAINGTNYQPQDIQDWDKDVEVDMIFHGSPCQDFSIAGSGKGGVEGSGTRSSLMWKTVEIVEKLKPKYVFWENVKSVTYDEHKPVFFSYLDKLASIGYTNNYSVFDTADYDSGQGRERIIVCSVLGGGSIVYRTQSQYLQINVLQIILRMKLQKTFISQILNLLSLSIIRMAH